MPEFHIPDLSAISISATQDFLCAKPSSWGAWEQFHSVCTPAGKSDGHSQSPKWNAGLHKLGQLHPRALHLKCPGCCSSSTREGEISECWPLMHPASLPDQDFWIQAWAPCSANFHLDTYTPSLHVKVHTDTPTIPTSDLPTAIGMHSSTESIISHLLLWKLQFIPQSSQIVLDAPLAQSSLLLSSPHVVSSLFPSKSTSRSLLLHLLSHNRAISPNNSMTAFQSFPRATRRSPVPHTLWKRAPFQNQSPGSKGSQTDPMQSELPNLTPRNDSTRSWSTHTSLRYQPHRDS